MTYRGMVVWFHALLILDDFFMLCTKLLYDAPCGKD
jgi:hypothetical protein